jgi:ABC-type Mn2+/Zn2+ transport system ATPase subunit
VPGRPRPERSGQDHAAEGTARPAAAIGGHDHHRRAGPRRGSAQTGYIPQQRDFDRDLPIRGRDLVRFGVDGYRRGLSFSRACQVDAVGAADYADAPIGLLSGGQQQRLRIAQALAGQPRLLLCDELLLSLDPSSAGSVVALLGAYRREHGITVVMVTHEIPPRPGSLTVSPMSPPAAGRPARPAR